MHGLIRQLQLPAESQDAYVCAARYELPLAGGVGGAGPPKVEVDGVADGRLAVWEAHPLHRARLGFATSRQNAMRCFGQCPEAFSK